MNPESQPSKRWPLSRNTTLALIFGIIALVIIVIIAAALTQNKSSNSTADQLYHDRPGYDRSQLSGAIADPFAISFAANPTPILYKGKKVIQACNILTLDDITGQGLRLKDNVLTTPVTRVFNDGVGTAAYHDQIYASSLSGAASLGRDINDCHYIMNAKSGAPSITIMALQPFAVPANTVAEEIQTHYTPAGNVEGLEVYKKSNSSSVGLKAAEYIVKQGSSGGFYASFKLDDTHQPKITALLQTAAKNFVQQQKNPTGFGKLQYKSPVFPKNIVRACDLVTSNDIAELSGREAGPLAREGIATAVGLLDFQRFTGDSTLYPYVTNTCTRGTTGGGSGLGADGPGDIDLEVETRSFLTPTAAKIDVEFRKQTRPTNPSSTASMPLPTKIGDGGVAYTGIIASDHHVVFYKGRIVVDIRTPRLTNESLSAAVEKLTPIAKSIADRLNSED